MPKPMSACDELSSAATACRSSALMPPPLALSAEMSVAVSPEPAFEFGRFVIPNAVSTRVPGA
jgi:hypothetical protein